jgi:hypothetical protein
VTAKADQPWLWGVQSAVEAIFIAQAKDDILAYLEYCQRLFKELHRSLQVYVHRPVPTCLQLVLCKSPTAVSSVHVAIACPVGGKASCHV